MSISYSKSSNILFVFHVLVLTSTHYLSSLQVFASKKKKVKESNQMDFNRINPTYKKNQLRNAFGRDEYDGEKKSAKSDFSKLAQGAENCYL